MGLLERTRHLLSGALDVRLAAGEDDGAILLELELLRMDLEGWLADLAAERDRIESDRKAQDAEILRLEKRVRGALEEEDERTARTEISRKRDAVTRRSSLSTRRDQIHGRVVGVERDLTALAARIAALRARRAAR